MKFVSIAILVCVASMAAALLPPGYVPDYDLNQAPQLFEKFIRDYHKVYRDEQDKMIHYIAFVNGLININELNRQQNPRATFGINQFTDQTPEEQRGHTGLLSPTPIPIQY